MSDNPKPEGYPYVRRHWNGYVYVPTLVDWHPAGFAMVSDVRPGTPDGLAAKREAIEWAESMGVPYKTEIS